MADRRTRGDRMAFLSALSLGLWAPAAVAVEVEPHRATYVIELTDQEPGAGILALEGEQIVLWERVCDGWVIEQELDVDILYAQGTTLHFRVDYDVWESMDGQDLRFNARVTVNQMATEEYSGIATLSGNGPGTAHYRLPGPRQLPLPAGTLFPTGFSREMLRRAKEGEFQYDSLLFDGSEGSGVEEARITIGAPIPAGESTEELLAQSVSWPIEMSSYAYEADGGRGPLLDEVRSRLHANGVTEWWEAEMDGFAIRADLRKLVALDLPAC